MDKKESREVTVVVRWRRMDGTWHEFPFAGEARHKASWYHVKLVFDLDRWNKPWAYSHYGILGDDKFEITDQQMTELERGKEIVIDRRAELYVRPKTRADEPRAPWWHSLRQSISPHYDRPRCSCAKPGEKRAP